MRRRWRKSRGREETSERIVLELKERIKEIATTLPSGLDSKQKTLIADAVMALISLGYGRAVAEKAVSEAARRLQTVDNIEVLVREGAQIQSMIGSDLKR